MQCNTWAELPKLYLPMKVVKSDYNFQATIHFNCYLNKASVYLYIAGGKAQSFKSRNEIKKSESCNDAFFVQSVKLIFFWCTEVVGCLVIGL